MAFITAAGARNRARFAAALDAERIRRTFGHGRTDLERRQVVGARHGVVHVRAGQQLSLVVIDRVFEQRLSDALRDAAVHLAFDDHRIDDRCRSRRPRSRQQRPVLPVSGSISTSQIWQPAGNVKLVGS